MIANKWLDLRLGSAVVSAVGSQILVIVIVKSLANKNWSRTRFCCAKKKIVVFYWVFGWTTNTTDRKARTNSKLSEWGKAYNGLREPKSYYLNLKFYC